jgi:hypothetical protein
MGPTHRYREDPMNWEDIICRIYGWDRILDWFRWETDPTAGSSDNNYT